MPRLGPRIDNPWDLSLVASFVILAIALGFAVVPPGRRVDPSVGLRKSLAKTRSEGSMAIAAADAAAKRTNERTWDSPPEALSVRVMDVIDAIAERRGLQVASFVVGRPIPSAGLRQVPFALTLNGSFSSVLVALAELEKPGSKLVVGSVRIVPNSDGLDLGRVSATLSVTAFLRGEGL